MINTMTKSNQKKGCDKCKNKNKQTLGEFMKQPSQIVILVFASYLLYCGVKETYDIIYWLIN
jgi:hypothetical protein